MSTMNSYNICEKVRKKFVFIALVIKYNNIIDTIHSITFFTLFKMRNCD